MIQKAHRLNTVQRSGRVFLVELGKMAGPGTFSELRQKNGSVQVLAKLMAIEPAD